MATVRSHPAAAEEMVAAEVAVVLTKRAASEAPSNFEVYNKQ
jgi:hypothetical protein